MNASINSAFNSLFEMRRVDTHTYLLRATAQSFNSLFEMP